MKGTTPLLYPEKAQNPEARPPVRPLSDDSDRPPRSDGAEHDKGNPLPEHAQAPPPEAASPTQQGESTPSGRSSSSLGHQDCDRAAAGEPGDVGAIPTRQHWSEPMPHANGQNDHYERTGMLALIDRYLHDPSADMERLERMLAFEKDLMAKQAEIEFLEAKSRIKKKLAHIRIVKNKAVLYDIVKNDPKQGQAEAFKFAPLEEIDKHLAPLLAEEDMDLSYTTRPRAGDGGGAVIVGKLRHVKGHWEESEIPLPLDTSGGKNNLQAMGSTNSYGRRYVACNLFNVVVVGDDDDGTGGAIDEAQAKAIRALLEQTGSNEAAFLKYLKASSIEAIPYRAYPKAMSALEEKLAKGKPS